MNAFRLMRSGGEFLRRPSVARIVLCALTLVTTAYAVNLFSGTLVGGGMNMLERLLLPLFGVLFAWIALSFCDGDARLCRHDARRPPLERCRQQFEGGAGRAQCGADSRLQRVAGGHRSPASMRC